MSKLFKRIMLIALVSVLVLGVSVSASASTSTVKLPIEQPYDNGQYNLYANAKIERRYTYGEISVNDGEYDKARVSVDVTYNYIRNLDYSVITSTGSQAQYGGAIVTSSETDIFTMIDATYTFEATIPTSNGINTYSSYPVLLEY